MNPNILHKDVQRYIDLNLDTDVTTLIFKGKTIKNVNVKQIVEQIEAKRKSKTKLPSWFNTSGIYYPNKLNIEQTSSEVTAKFKSELISGHRIIDITGGFGVDCYYFSKQFDNVIHCEINSKLSEIVSHNLKVMDTDNIIVADQNGLDYLKETVGKFDWIYIDPSRRHHVKGKVVFLKDCLPNVPEQLDFLFTKTEQILVKTSPLLDISIGHKELKHVETIYILSVNNEVKELLWVLKKGFRASVKIYAVNLHKKRADAFEFILDEEQNAVSTFSLPETYLYEPNVAIFKAGAFKLISKKLGVNKLHVNSHLYTSEDLLSFPGRRFKIENIWPYNKKLLKKELPKKANITIRNFPITVQEIRKKFKIQEGGETYLYFTTNLLNEKTILVCSKVD